MNTIHILLHVLTIPLCLMSAAQQVTHLFIDISIYTGIGIYIHGPNWHLRFSLQWRHNGRDGVSNHRHLHCLLNYWFKLRQKRSKFCVTCLCAGNSPVTGQFMMTSSNVNIFRVTGHLWGEFTGPRWIPLAKASDAELWCFLWSSPEQTVEQTI